MLYFDLTIDQQTQLAASLIDQRNTENGIGTSWDELARPFEYITPEEVAEHYAGVDFSADDFALCEPDNEPEPPTRVAFRAFPEGDIIAIFPDIIEDNRGSLLSYQHVGQHGGCAPELLTDLRPATHEEFASLADELRGIGYTLDDYEHPNDPDTCKQFCVYLGYYESYITTKPMDAPRVFQKVFETIEDAIEYCFYDLEDPIVICKDCVKHWPLFYWCDPRDFTNYDPETDTVQNWEFDSIAGEYKLEKAA